MDKVIRVILIVCIIFTSQTVKAFCIASSIKKNLDHGSVIILRNNIPWEIDHKYRGDTTLWLRGDRVIVCDKGSIFHLYYGDWVGARKIH